MNEEKAESDFNQEIVVMLKEILKELRTLNEMWNITTIVEISRIAQYIESVIGKSKRRADVYLATDGIKTASLIAQQLGMKRPNVSVDQNLLLKAGIIQPHVKWGKGFIYRKSSIHEIIGFAGLLLMQDKRQDMDLRELKLSNTNGEGETSARE